MNLKYVTSYVQNLTDNLKNTQETLRGKEKETAELEDKLKRKNTQISIAETGRGIATMLNTINNSTIEWKEKDIEEKNKRLD